METMDSHSFGRFLGSRIAVLVALAMLAVVLAAGAAMAETRTLEGTVTYRERIALPPGATVEVALLDVSLADAPATTVAETIVAPTGQVPVPYKLSYDSGAIVAGRSYALQARIVQDGRLLFLTTTRHSVLAGGPDQTDLVLERVGQEDRADAGAAPPAGRWLAEDIRGGGGVDDLQSVLELGADGSVSGTGGCNRMAGQAEIDGERIAFGPLAATQMACVPAAMDQEAKFFAALADARSWRADEARDKLILLDAEGSEILVLARQ